MAESVAVSGGVPIGFWKLVNVVEIRFQTAACLHALPSEVLDGGAN